MGDLFDLHMEMFEEMRRERILAADQDNILPSAYDDDYWIYAFNKVTKRKASKSGKWMIFSDVSEVDRDWEIIREATRAGKLGFQSKVSTAMVSSLSKDNGQTRVICVFTSDYSNQDEVFLVRSALVELGFGKILYYKPDYMTHKGQYGGKAWLYRG